MSRLILFCVETNKGAKTDEMYIDAILKQFYTKYSLPIKFDYIHMNTKTMYDSKEVKNKINSLGKKFRIHNKDAIVSVCYVIDLDMADANVDQKKLNDKIFDYANQNGYKVITFNKTVEDVLLKRRVTKDEKVQIAKEFARKNRISKISSKALLNINNSNQTSNILAVLDTMIDEKYYLNREWDALIKWCDVRVGLN